MENKIKIIKFLSTIKELPPEVVYEVLSTKDLSSREKVSLIIGLKALNNPVSMKFMIKSLENHYT